MQKIKDSFFGTLGIFGYILFYVGIFCAVFVPLYTIGLPWLACVLIGIAMNIITILGAVVPLVAWIVSFFFIFRVEFSVFWYILYAVSLLFYLAFFFIPAVIQLFKK